MTSRLDSFLDRVHVVGMSPNGSTYLTVNSVNGLDNKEVSVHPPIEVVFEGDDARVAVTQDGLAARYDDEELRRIGEGNSSLGLYRVIGDIAMHGNFELDAIKPLHPTLIEGHVVSRANIVATRPELTT